MESNEKDEKYSQLYETYFSALCQYCRSCIVRTKLPMYMVEDIVNEAYYRLYCRWDEHVDQGLPVNYKWLCSAVRYIVLDEYDRNVYQDISLDNFDKYIMSNDEIRDKIEEIQYQYYISCLSKLLSQEEMKLFENIMEADMSYKDVEARTGVASVTLRVKVSRMRKKLKSLIADILKE